jgi:hypothetical protein
VTCPRIEIWLLRICVPGSVTCGRNTKPPSRSDLAIFCSATPLDEPPTTTFPISGKLIWPFSEIRASTVRSGF